MDEKIVYIIVALIWIVTSIVKAVNKNKKKAEQQSNPQPENTNMPSGMEDFKKILEEMISGKQQNVPTPQAVNEYQNMDYTPIDNMEIEKSKYADFQGSTEYSFSNYTNLEDLYDIEKAKNESLMQNDFYNAMPKNVDRSSLEDMGVGFFNNSLDLRNAVIYSEILKRPHY